MYLNKTIKLILVIFVLKNLITLTVSLRCSEKYKEATSFVPQISSESYHFKSFVHDEGYLFYKLYFSFFFSVHLFILDFLKFNVFF